MNNTLKYGLIGGFAYIVANLLLTLWHNVNTSVNLFISIFIFSFIIRNANVAVDLVKNESKGFISFKKAFIVAFSIFLISITLSNVYTLIQDQVFFPEKYEEAKIEAIEIAEEKMGEEYAALYTSIYNRVFQPTFMFILKMIGAGFIYFIVALIIAGVKKNEDAHQILN